MKKAIIVAGLLVGLGGCANGFFDSEAQFVRRQCINMGIPETHPAFADCVIKIANARQQSAGAMTAAGLMMMQNSQPRQQGVTCIRTGNITRCE